MKRRNVFLSFAGAGNYTPVNYVNTELGIDYYTQFAQVATAKAVVKNFGPDDAIIIFTTDKSFTMYWEDDKGNPRELQRQLKELNDSCCVKHEPISSGSNESDIWEMFTTIYDCINENDVVHFDVTSGFRSQPLLTLPLINYAKFLKNVTVAGIYYGNFQGAGQDAPVWDLTDFSKLQDWTNNANIFLRTGNAKGLAEQIEGDAYAEIKEGLERFSEFTLVNRGMDIYSGQEIMKLSKDLEQAKESEDPAEKAVLPILNKVKDQFKNYQENAAINGIYATRWCIENGLIQQAATLIEEFVTTYVMELLNLKEIDDEQYRNVVLKRVQFGSNFNTKHSKLSQEETENICNGIKSLPEYKSLQKVVTTVSGEIRNDINHAGFRKEPGAYDDFRSLTIAQFNLLCDILARRGHRIDKLPL